MTYRLHKRDPDPEFPVRGLSCDENGVFFAGDCPLVTSEIIRGRRSYQVRPCEEINRALSAGYGVPVDFSKRLASLNRVAQLLSRGEWGLAQITALQMKLPDLPDDDAVERLRKVDHLTRANPNHYPPGPHGGQFAPGGQEGSSTSVRVRSLGASLVIESDNGGLETRSGGSLAWRNNNPGNLVPGPMADRHGAIGRHEGFAVFPDEQTGEAAQRALLTSNYADHTLDEAVAAWAPPKENNTARYQTLVRQWTGLTGGVKIRDLTPDQVSSVMAAQRRMEGWRVGSVTRKEP